MFVTFVDIAKYGIASGVVMSIAGMALQMSGFTKLDTGSYLGCLLTGQKSGTDSVLSSLATHFAASIGIAYLYVQAMNYFDLSLSLQTACILGLANTLVSGTITKAIDTIHPCVKSKKIPAFGLFASGYGVHGIIAYTLTHLVFAVTFLKLLGAPLSF